MRKLQEDEFGSFARSMMSIDDYMRPHAIYDHKAESLVYGVDEPMVFQHYGKAMSHMRHLSRIHYKELYLEEMGEKAEEWINGFASAFYMPVMLKEGDGG